MFKGVSDMKTTSVAHPRKFDHDHTESPPGAFEVIARLFGAADVVIGYHGAGLVNAMFMRRHALVIEITTTFKSVCCVLFHIPKTLRV